VQLEGLGQLKKKWLDRELNPTTFRLVEWCLSEVRYSMDLSNLVSYLNVSSVDQIYF
jgi:hypothetical protein